MEMSEVVMQIHSHFMFSIEDSAAHWVQLTQYHRMSHVSLGRASWHVLPVPLTINMFAAQVTVSSSGLETLKVERTWLVLRWPGEQGTSDICVSELPPGLWLLSIGGANKSMNWNYLQLQLVYQDPVWMINVVYNNNDNTTVQVMSICVKVSTM